MHITDWLEMLGEHFPLVVIGCAEALLAVVLLCAALRQGYAAAGSCADKLLHGAQTAETRRKKSSVWKKYRRKWDGAKPFETAFGQRTAAGLGADTGS